MCIGSRLILKRKNSIKSYFMMIIAKISTILQVEIDFISILHQNLFYFIIIHLAKSRYCGYNHNITLYNRMRVIRCDYFWNSILQKGRF